MPPRWACAPPASSGIRPACGGTCLLRGCIPTKALLHTADLYEEMKHAKDFGIVAEGLSLDFPAVMSRKTRIVNRLSKGIESYLFKKNKITLFKGQGRLEGPGTRGREGGSAARRRSRRRTSSWPPDRVPAPCPGLALDGKTIISSDEILQIQAIPRSLVVIGAGAVGMEFASVFARFGSTVTVIELLPRVLPARGRGDLERGGQAPREVHDHPHRRQDGGRAQDRAGRRGRLPHRRRPGQERDRRRAAGGGRPRDR